MSKNTAKKLFSITIVGLLGLSMFTACGKSKETTKTTEATTKATTEATTISAGENSITINLAWDESYLPTTAKGHLLYTLDFSAASTKAESAVKASGIPGT